MKKKVLMALSAFMHDEFRDILEVHSSGASIKVILVEKDNSS